MSAVLAPQFTLREFTNRIWRVSADEGANPDSFIKPEAWVHVASNFTIGDIIEVVPVDGVFYQRLLVRDCANTWAKVSEIERVILTQTEEEAKTNFSKMDEFEIKWAGPAKFRVTRKSDGAVVSNTGFQTKEDAIGWLAQYIKEMGA